MGVSGLHAFLQPHGTCVSLHVDNEASISVVIDGPALAYHLWRTNRLLEGQYRSFKVILLEFIRILAEVAGLKIEIVYFDGYLPPHKREIRHSRANGNLERVKKNQGSLIHSTPSPALAVVLTQDVLRNAGVKVQVVDEEADTACARRTKEISLSRQCYLMSMDSDFHCFDLGEDGYYLPFDGMQYTDTSFTARVYSLSKTQSALGVYLLELVTLMGSEGSQQASRSATESMKMLGANGNKLHGLVSAAEIKRVQDQFSVEPRDGHLSSELADQGLIYGRLAEACHFGDFWLPQLLEDRSKASVWADGLMYRASAYRLLEAKGLFGHRDMTEWVRRSEHITGQKVNSVHGIESVIVETPATAHSVFLEAMRTLVSSCEKSGKPLSQTDYHSFIIMAIGTIHSSESQTTIDVLHLTARYQAIVYSITMLLQVQGASEWPLASQLYDLQTFLAARKAMESGISMQELTRGHEDVVSKLIAKMGWEPPKHIKKTKRKRR